MATKVYDVFARYRIERMIDGKWMYSGEQTTMRLGVFFDHATAKRYATNVLLSDNRWKTVRRAKGRTISRLYDCPNPAHDDDFFMGRKPYTVPYSKAPMVGYNMHDVNWTTREPGRRTHSVKRYIVEDVSVKINTILSREVSENGLKIKKLPFEKDAKHGNIKASNKSRGLRA